MALALGCGGAWAQTATVAIPVGATIQAELRTRLDTGHARKGEAIEAVATADVKQHGEKIPLKGARLQGEITAVTPAESPKSPAHLSIVFTQARLRNGQKLALHAVVTQLRRIRPPQPPVMSAPPLPPPMQPMPDADSQREQATLGSMPVPSQITGPDTSVADLRRRSQLKPIRIRVQGGESTLSSVGNFQLERGTELRLKEIAAPVPGPGQP
ncbi:MAG: hypothetical protein ACRD04_07545 [Terriglobales bacterium]